MTRLFSWFQSPQRTFARGEALAAQGKLVEAFSEFARAAEANLPEAALRVARCYLEGKGVPPSTREGARWLERAAEAGLAEAQALLAALYLRGIPAGTAGAVASEALELASVRPAAALFASNEAAAPDFERALCWARQAAENGSADGQALLGYILSSGPKTLRDLPAAEEWYRRAAAARCPQGQFGYALALLREAGDAKRVAEGMAELTAAAEAGLPTAQYLSLIHI